MKTKILRILSFVLAALILCGCQATPKDQAVTSKNDGVFQEKVAQTTPASVATDPVDILWDEHFTSTDGSVEFTLDMDQSLAAAPMPVIEVEPHWLTGQEVKRVAEVLFGESDFFEQPDSARPNLSKHQYRERIALLSPYASRDALAQVMGNADADMWMEYVQLFLNSYTEKMEAAPSEDTRIPCDFQLKQASRYNSDMDSSAGKSQALSIMTNKDGIEYNLYAWTRNAPDFKQNNINVQMSSPLGLFDVERAIYRSRVCRTEKPTEDQIQALADKAQKMLDDMALGQWYISETRLITSPRGDSTEYAVRVEAFPVIGGISVIPGQSVVSTGGGYRDIYSITASQLEFAPNGTLLSFQHYSTLDVVGTANEQVETLPIEALMERARDHLSLSDAGSYGLPARVLESLEESAQERILCRVLITQADYGMARVDVPDSDCRFYYIPILTLKGTAEYIGEQSGELYYATSMEDAPIRHLLWLNSVDGSVIQ